MTASVTIHPTSIQVSIGEQVWSLPVAIEAIQASFTTDPPLPEELINAIGLVIDHLDDVVHAQPELLGAATVELAGVGTRCFADVECGHPTGATRCQITRADAEDLFRTMVTETRSERRLNPGLGDHDIDVIVATCCVVVAVIRRLHLDAIDIVDQGATGS